MLVAHLPPRRVQLVRRYGAYSGKVRNHWKQAHQLRMLANQEAKPAAVDSDEVPGANAGCGDH